MGEFFRGMKMIYYLGNIGLVNIIVIDYFLIIN